MLLTSIIFYDTKIRDAYLIIVVNVSDNLEIYMMFIGYNHSSLFHVIPTIDKFIIKYTNKLDFTSNLRISNRALGILQFKERESSLSVVLGRRISTIFVQNSPTCFSFTYQ